MAKTEEGRHRPTPSSDSGPECVNNSHSGLKVLEKLQSRVNKIHKSPNKCVTCGLVTAPKLYPRFQFLFIRLFFFLSLSIEHGQAKQFVFDKLYFLLKCPRTLGILTIFHEPCVIASICIHDRIHTVLTLDFVCFVGPPTAEKKELTKVARLGEEVRLICPMSGYPEPIISWTKDKETIDSYSWVRFKPVKKSLKIKDVSKEDTGIYVCKGINGFGSEEIRIDLIVISKSRAKTNPKVGGIEIDFYAKTEGKRVRESHNPLKKPRKSFRRNLSPRLGSV